MIWFFLKRRFDPILPRSKNQEKIIILHDTAIYERQNNDRASRVIFWQKVQWPSRYKNTRRWFASGGDPLELCYASIFPRLDVARFSQRLDPGMAPRSG